MLSSRNGYWSAQNSGNGDIRELEPDRRGIYAGAVLLHGLLPIIIDSCIADVTIVLADEK